MEDVLFGGPAAWRPFLPPGTWLLQDGKTLKNKPWGIVALMPDSREQMRDIPVQCRCLLVAGEWDPGWLTQIHTEQVVTYGLSPRDSLTLSSLQSPVLCVQRILQGMNGALVEPQEILLPQLPFPAEEMLPLLGMKLLRMPLTGPCSFGNL